MVVEAMRLRFKNILRLLTRKKEGQIDEIIIEEGTLIAVGEVETMVKVEGINFQQ